METSRHTHKSNLLFSVMKYHNTYVIFVKVAWMIGMCSNCHVRHNFFSFIYIYSLGVDGITSHVAPKKIAVGLRALWLFLC